MIRSLSINLSLGLTAFILTFIFALPGNLLSVSLVRGCYAFVIFFLAAFVVRWAFQLILGKPPEEESTGNRVDLVTPDEATPDEGGEGQPMPANTETGEPAPQPKEGDAQFSPLLIPRLEKQDDAYRTSDLVHTIRRFSDE
ncbi:hypothetical protein ACI7RC_01915 [Brevibacillus sp. B_LB10_24]|uniref:hypothetical protein n=1 Tax=Brevibacillus sp. B_LB10_24 TaxID=3380645 RepID=UPI0038BD1131